MIVALRFYIRVGHQEYSKDDDHNIPTRENEARMAIMIIHTLI